MIRLPQKGERVRLIPKGQISATQFREGKTTAYWNIEDGETATIDKVVRRDGRLLWIVVRPDPPNFGRFIVKAKDLERI